MQLSETPLGLSTSVGFRRSTPKATWSVLALASVMIGGCGGGGDESRTDAGGAAGGTAGMSTRAGGSAAGGTAPMGAAGAGGVGGCQGAACGGSGGSFQIDGSSPDVSSTGAGGSGAGGTAGMVDANVEALPNPPAACGRCTTYGAPELLGNVMAPELSALSGMAASWKSPGVLFVHNDRGSADHVEFFAVNGKGNLLGRFTFSGAGASAHDIEDMEVAKCPSGTCVYLADIGNNIPPMRSELVIFRVPEPQVDPEKASTTTTQLQSFERFAFRYPDGGTQHNAESILVDSKTGAVYIIDKVAAGQRSTVYKIAALDATKAVTATKVGELPVPAAGDQPTTAATAHPCGLGFLLRTNNALYEFPIGAGAAFDDAFAVTPVKLMAGAEMQSEAVTYAPDGRGYYTTSEGSKPPIHHVGCQ